MGLLRRFPSRNDGESITPTLILPPQGGGENRNGRKKGRMDSRLLGNDIEEKKMQGRDLSSPNKDGFDESNPYVIATIISNWSIGRLVNWSIN